MTVSDDKHCFFTQDGLTEGGIVYNAYVSYIVEIFLVSLYKRQRFFSSEIDIYCFSFECVQWVNIKISC